MTEPIDAEIIALCGSREFSTIGAVREALRRWGTHTRMRDDGRYGDPTIQQEWEAWQAPMPP